MQAQEIILPHPPDNRHVLYSGGDAAHIKVNGRKPASAYMAELNGRKVRKGRNITVASEEITIQVYDKNENDGDCISLHYGDSPIVPILH